MLHEISFHLRQPVNHYESSAALFIDQIQADAYHDEFYHEFFIILLIVFQEVKSIL